MAEVEKYSGYVLSLDQDEMEILRAVLGSISSAQAWAWAEELGFEVDRTKDIPYDLYDIMAQAIGR